MATNLGNRRLSFDTSTGALSLDAEGQNVKKMDLKFVTQSGVLKGFGKMNQPETDDEEVADDGDDHMTVVYLEKVENIPRMGLLTHYFDDDDVVIDDPAAAERQTTTASKGCLSCNCNSGVDKARRSCVKMWIVHTATGQEGPPVFWDYRRGNRTPTWYSARSIAFPNLEEGGSKGSDQPRYRSRDFRLKITIIMKSALDNDIPIATGDSALDKVSTEGVSILTLQPKATTFQKYRDQALDYLGSPGLSNPNAVPATTAAELAPEPDARAKANSSASSPASGASPKKFAEQEFCKVHLRKLEVGHLDTLLNEKAKTVYFVRHGESLWNEAQDNCLLWRMPQLFDAPLSFAGKEQCEALSKTTQHLFAKNPPSVIFCSPLTRAIQTAVIGFQSYISKTQLILMPSVREKKNSIAAVDSAGIAIGADIIDHVQKELQLLYEGDEEDDTEEDEAKEGNHEGNRKAVSRNRLSTKESIGEMAQEKVEKRASKKLASAQLSGLSPPSKEQTENLLRRYSRGGGSVSSDAVVQKYFDSKEKPGKGTLSSVDENGIKTEKARVTTKLPDFVHSFRNLVDTKEVQDQWWNSWGDTTADMKRRLDDFMCQLVYSPYDEIVVVGHSHFFREIFRRYIHSSFEKSQPSFVKDLRKKKVENAGMVKLQLKTDLYVRGVQTPIVDVEMCAPSQLAGDDGMFAACKKKKKVDEGELKVNEDVMTKGGR